MPAQLLLTIVSFNLMVMLLLVCMIAIYRKPASWPTALCLFLGYLVGFVDLQVSEVQFPVLLLLAFGFFIGFSSRNRALLHGVLLAGWVPLGALVKYLAMPGALKFGPEVFGSLLAFVPAFVGIGIGVVMQRRDNDVEQLAGE
jgi:hypothetical protein